VFLLLPPWWAAWALPGSKQSLGANTCDPCSAPSTSSTGALTNAILAHSHIITKMTAECDDRELKRRSLRGVLLADDFF